MTRGKDSPDAPRAQRREATRRALLDAAAALAERDGANPLDPAQLAVEAGVSRPLFYAHFGDRAGFVDALLAALHEGSGPPAVAPGLAPRERVLAFFEALAAPLDRRAPLARAIVPASHQPGALAEARGRRRARAIAVLTDLLPGALPDCEARAAVLMDAFLGLQLAWSKGQRPGALAACVRRELAWLLDGVLVASSPPHAPSPTDPRSPS
ncbi:MAG: TetR/AcrR family transcriptional regulator [Planctomycetes bacterium]|nr:TetR/AcrR family transcriptional regulator [Planctomycetota bacterium]